MAGGLMEWKLAGWGSEVVQVNSSTRDRDGSADNSDDNDNNKDNNDKHDNKINNNLLATAVAAVPSLRMF